MQPEPVINPDILEGSSSVLPNATLDNFCSGFLYYYFTSLLIVMSIIAGPYFIRFTKQGDLADSFGRWDGEWYRQIAEEGYKYEPTRNSNVAFFPVFPLLGRTMAWMTGLPCHLALLLVAHLSLAASFGLLIVYLNARHERIRSPILWVLLAFACWPTTCFFRMVYSEPLFFLLALLAFYGMEKKWHILPILLVIGIATATRPVGVALVLPLLLHLWSPSASWKDGLRRCTLLAPVACWGLASFIVFQHLTFDEPLAFAKNQAHWRVRPPVSAGEHSLALLTLEPIWSIFDPSSPCFWKNHEPNSHPLFCLHLANPIYFVLAIALIILGGYKRWLTNKELALAAGLLLIPYLTRSHEMCMGSMGRFTAVVFPVYIVLGHLLDCMPRPVAIPLFALSGFLMASYAALFAAGHRIF